MHDIAGIFRSVFESEADAYWCFEKFMQRVHGRSLATQVNVVVVWTEAQDPELWKHLTESGIDVRAAVDQWFGCLFVTYLPVSAIERYGHALHRSHSDGRAESSIASSSDLSTS